MSLWDIATNLEDVNVGLHQIKNLLQIYDESIEYELQFVEKHPGEGSVSYFVDRYDLLRSLLEVIQSHARDTAEILQKQINSIHAAALESSTE